jgi:hypothetical protein
VRTTKDDHGHCVIGQSTGDHRLTCGLPARPTETPCLARPRLGKLAAAGTAFALQYP